MSKLFSSCLIVASIIATVSMSVAQEPGVSPATSPKITSVSKITTAQHQTITIKGSGFGTHAPYTGDSDYIAVWDCSKTHGWQAGYSGFDDTITLIVHKWDNTEIILGGFAGAWGKPHSYTIVAGNKMEIQVWNAQTGAGPATKTVSAVKADTTTELTSSLNPSVYGESVTFTAVVTSSGGAPADGEKVSFMNGTTVLGTGTLIGGVASFTMSTLASDTNSIRAVYHGDADFAGTRDDEESASLTQSVK